MSVSLTVSDAVTVLDLGEDENRFTPAWMTDVEEALDEVVAKAPTALVTTAEGRFFSNGLDLEWLGAHLEEYDAYLTRVQNLLARFLLLPVPTVAAIPGHAFGMGAALALAHDARLMRADRGYFCFPEIDLGLSFTPGMLALIRATLPANTALEATTTGRRYDAESATAAGIVAATAGIEELRTRAVDHMQPLTGKDAATLGGIKQAIHADVAARLTGRRAGLEGAADLKEDSQWH